MTIRSMQRATGALLLILAAAALFLSVWSRESSEAATEVAAEQAALLADARAEIDALEERAGLLEADLAEATAASRSDDLALRMEEVTARLWASVKKLRAALSESRSTGKAAASDAASAAANAGAALRELTILENRFEYHLRQEGSG